MKTKLNLCTFIFSMFSFLYQDIGNNATFYNRPNYYTLGVGKLMSRNYGFKIQASVTYVDGSLGVNHDNDTATNEVFTDEILFRLITTISF